MYLGRRLYFEDSSGSTPSCGNAVRWTCRVNRGLGMVARKFMGAVNCGSPKYPDRRLTPSIIVDSVWCAGPEASDVTQLDSRG